MGELASFGAGLENKPMMLVASKIDVANKEKLAKLKRYAKKHDVELYTISAVTGKGIDELKWAMANKVEQIRSQEANQESAAEDGEIPDKAQQKA
jgi:GTP-binding protein